MRHSTTLRVVSSAPAAARVAATALLAAVALAMLAAPALAGTASHRSHSSAHSVTAHPTSPTAPNPTASPRATAPGGSGTPGQRSTSGTGSSSRLIMRAALVGAVIMSMLTAGLFVFGAELRRASGPKVQPSRSTGHDQTDHSPEPDSYPARLASATRARCLGRTHVAGRGERGRACLARLPGADRRATASNRAPPGRRTTRRSAAHRIRERVPEHPTQRPHRARRPDRARQPSITLRTARTSCSASCAPARTPSCSPATSGVR